MPTGAALDEGAPYWGGGVADPPFTLLLGTHALTVPPVATGWWIRTLSRGDWGAIARLLDDDQQLSTALESAELEDLDAQDIHRMACQVAETVAGCPWPTAVRLCALLTGSTWLDFEVYCTRRTSIDPLTAPLRRVLGAVYSMLLEGAKDEAETRRIRAEYANAADTNAPPPPKTGTASDRGAPQVPGSKYRTFTPEEAAAAFAAASNESFPSHRTEGEG
ncbi:hypothetical protein RCO28_37960 [Streptomyces sp. LHD-70]|uniref:hypothetical protein n=1 Tax=Streptomyces sp. LHD-70 TaxID=3072140 RepID=UPI00280FC87E|nr:hypothetical protein [Streptomyces sp. LHD-70]MDQ8708204.1 hypothetical protein [Streptomyces sp. LHD-70]